MFSYVIDNRTILPNSVVFLLIPSVFVTLLECVVTNKCRKMNRYNLFNINCGIVNAQPCTAVICDSAVEL